MKKLIFVLIFILSFSASFSQQSNFPKITKSDLITFINKAKEEGKINDNVLVVLDENFVLNINSLKDDHSFFGQISLIEKNNKEMAQIYGNDAINGVILIQSPPKDPEGNEVVISNEIVLFFIDNKEISKKELEKINPDDIKNLRVIKSKKEIKNYTNKECDGIVVIELKKQ